MSVHPGPTSSLLEGEKMEGLGDVTDLVGGMLWLWVPNDYHIVIYINKLNHGSNYALGTVRRVPMVPGTWPQFLI